MITVPNMLIQIFLAIMAAYLVMLLNRLARARLWLPTLSIILLMIAFFLDYNSIDLFSFSKFSSSDLLIYLSATMLIISLLFLGQQVRKGNLRTIMCWHDRWKRYDETPGWRFLTGRQEDKFGLKLKNLPCLDLLNYDELKFTQINSRSGLRDQVALYHVIHRKEYISWVDATYWAILRKFSETGASVVIYLVGKNSNDSTALFEKYVKAIAGDKVRYDDSIYPRFSIVREVEQTKEDVGAPAYMSDYRKLACFASILPMFLGCPHTFILLWEGYYIEIDKLSSTILERRSITIDKLDLEDSSKAEVALDGFHVSFILGPSAIATKRKNEEVADPCRLNPEDTFALGNYSCSETYRRTLDLCKASLKCIVFTILGPLLPGLWRWVFLVSSFVLLLCMSDRENGDRGFSRKVLSKLISKANFYIHRRMCGQIDD